MYSNELHLHTLQIFNRFSEEITRLYLKLTQRRFPLSLPLCSQNCYNNTHTHTEGYYDPRDQPSVLVTSPGSPDRLLLSNGASLYQAHTHPPHHQHQRAPHHPLQQHQHQSDHHHSAGQPRYRLLPNQPPAVDPNVGGKVQLKLGYDATSLQLVITLIGASALTLRADGFARNPYARVYLLPDRSEKSKRRTKTAAGTTEPLWGQSFRYCGFRRMDLCNRLIEVSGTIWWICGWELSETWRIIRRCMVFTLVNY